MRQRMIINNHDNKDELNLLFQAFENILVKKILDCQAGLHTIARDSPSEPAECCAREHTPRTRANFALPRDSPPYYCILIAFYLTLGSLHTHTQLLVNSACTMRCHYESAHRSCCRYSSFSQTLRTIDKKHFLHITLL